MFKRAPVVAGLLALLAVAACDRPVAPSAAALKTTNVQANAGGNQPVSNAVFTIVNNDVDGLGHCANGADDPQNCNIYDEKKHVWLGGEAVNGNGNNTIPNGTYFFTVLDPGGQQDPNDGAEEVLSDITPTTSTGAGDAYTNRTFSITNGVISYTGTHDFANNKIRLFGFDDTPNPGGEYIMAVCSLGEGYPVDPSDCKYDAFKVKVPEPPCTENCCADCPPPPPPEALPLTAAKTAAGKYDNKYVWGITKAVDKTVIKQAGGTATFNYTVTVTHDGGTISGVMVNGSITLNNPNPVAVAISGVSDVLSNSTACTVANVPATLASGNTSLSYSCSLDAVPTEALSNTATVTWADQMLSDGSHLAAGSASGSAADIAFAENVIDGSVSISDSYASLGTGTLTRNDAASTDFTYARNIAVLSNVCVDYGNTASFTTSTTSTSGSASQSVMVCGNVAGGLTIGFWQNKNGQAILTNGASTAGVCNSATWLRNYAPFQDLVATATCARVAAYATTIIKAANASGASMNAMLKAQMLATAFDVFFSDPSLGGNAILAPAPIGGVKVDLTMICSAIGSCSTTYGDVSAAFGGATALTVSELLSHAAGQSNAGGTTWYGQDKSVQEKAKNTFDAINNRVALVSP